MATVRGIELKTEIPGPRSREILARKDAVVAGPLSSTCPWSSRRAAARRSPTSTATRSSTSPAASAASTSATRTRTSSRPCRSRRRASSTPTSRSSRTRSTSRVAERLLALAPFRGPGEGGVLQRRHRGGRERGQVRARVHRPPGGDRVRGRLPRPHAPVADAHLEDAPVQGGARAVRAGGLPRAVPERVPRDQRGRGARRARARARRRRSRAETVAAIVVEPVQGEGGFVVAPPEFLARRARDLRPARDRARRRRGADRLRPHRPDVRDRALRHRARPASRSRSRSPAGLPLSGVLGKAEIMDAPGDGAIGGTYVGNPVAQAAALAVLDVIEEEGLVERAERIGEVIRGRMQEWQRRHPQIGDVRGLGAMLAIELVEDRETKQPAPALASAVAAAAAAAGPPAPEGRNPLELHPRPLPARDHGRGARRGARRLGRGAGGSPRVAVAGPRAFYGGGGPHGR